MQMIDGAPRRNRIDLQTPAEAAIRAAVETVEAAGAHQLLTDAINLLDKARDKVADFVEIHQELSDADVREVVAICDAALKAPHENDPSSRWPFPLEKNM